ncbi:MAG: hypothetical protein JSW60_05205 [Thermoplasmatales archaeon]|nr:MAG: hypothetical protein JSW60_05205 [Thermoplasmatales archaeon]
MKRRILPILASLLFITMIPSAIGEIANSESDIRTTDLDVGRTFYRGVVLFPHYSDDNLICFVLRLFYLEITPIERSWGWLTLGWVTFEKFTGKIITGPFNIIGYIFGYFEGGLEIP